MGLENTIISLCESLNRHWENVAERKKQQEHDKRILLSNARMVATTWLRDRTSAETEHALSLCLQKPLDDNIGEVIFHIRDPEQKNLFIEDLFAYRNRQKKRQ